MPFRLWWGLVALVLSIPVFGQLVPITYQGRLLENGQPVNGSRNVRFEVYNVPTGGIHGALVDQVVSVVNGVFTTTVLLPADLFTGTEERYLQLWINTSALMPRTRITFTPRSAFSYNTRGLSVIGPGHVGIGTDAPGGPLHVAFDHSSHLLMLQQTGQNNAFVRLRSPNLPDWTLEVAHSNSNSPGTLFLRNNFPLPSLAATTSGNIGIGTFLPKRRLHVAGDYYGVGHIWLHALEGDGSSGTAYLQARDDSDTSSINLVLRTQSQGSIVNVLHLSALGDVGVGGEPNDPTNSGRVLSITAPPNTAPALTLARGGLNHSLTVNSNNSLDLYSANTRYARFLPGGAGGGLQFVNTAQIPVLRLTAEETGGRFVLTDFVGVAQVSAQMNGPLGEVNADLFTGAVKFFRIDHPLDPYGKTLTHASIESDQMRNLYVGTVTTDDKGYATVKLPDWFEALNTDFHYQLTVVDRSEDFVLAKVVEPIAENRFVVRTSKPNVTVSWQVVGARHDAFARRFPMQVEAEKGGEESGNLIHPEAFEQNKR